MIIAELLRNVLLLGPIGKNWITAVAMCLCAAVWFRTSTSRAPSMKEATTLFGLVSLVGVVPWTVGALFAAYTGPGDGMSTPFALFIVANVLCYPLLGSSFFGWSKVSGENHET